MKKIYKLTLGAGAAATAAIPAIAVVSCGTKTSKKTESNTNSNTNTNTESKGTTGTHTSTVTNHQLNHVSLSTAQIDKQFATAKSDLLKRFIELKIADASTTDADFDKNFGDYAVKLLKVIATDENALSATDTANLIETILSKYSKDISSDILPEITKQVPVISKYISDNHLLKGALDALGFDKNSEDSDLLEKLDSNNLNLVKAALFVAKAVESVPKDLTAGTAESVITMIQSLGLPSMVSGLFPNTQEAMAAWATLLNSGIIQQVGQLLDAIITKGLGNIDFDEVKKDLEALIDNAVKTMNEAKASVAGMTGNNIKGLVDKLHIPALIDILKSIVTEGVFGIDTKITDEIKAVYDSHILALLGQLLPMDQYTSIINTFSGIINTVVNPNGGIASLTEAQFDKTLETIMGLIPGASLSDGIKGLISKVLFTGFADENALVDAIYSILPDSIKTMAPVDLSILGKLDVNALIKSLLTSLYKGTTFQPNIPMVGSMVKIDEKVAAGFTPILSKGLFQVSKEELEAFFTSIDAVLDKLNGLMGTVSMFSGMLPASAKPIVEELKQPLAAAAAVTKDQMVEVADGMYSLLHEGIAASAETLRKAVADITTTISKFVPAFVAPLAKVALNGLDGLTLEDAQALSDFIYSVIPANTPVVSSLEFKHLIFTVLVGNEKAEAYLAQKAAEEKAAIEAKAEADRKAAEAKAIADAKAAAIANANHAIDTFVAQNLPGSVSAEAKAKSSDKVVEADFVAPSATGDLSVAIKSISYVGTKVTVTYHVSSSVSGTKVVDYKVDFDGFQMAVTTNLEIMVNKLKEIKTSSIFATKSTQEIWNNYANGNSAGLTGLLTSFKNEMKALFPSAAHAIDALQTYDFLYHADKGIVAILLASNLPQSFAAIKLTSANTKDAASLARIQTLFNEIAKI